MKTTLTALQRKIVREIRRLHKRDEPLNITAVKRRHPELMKTVYEIKPFWGWKRALEAAGIDYHKIRIELEPYVKCEICGAYLRSFGSHGARIHGVTKDNYLIDYPESALVSEECRAQVSRVGSSLVTHREKLWSPEYLLDVADELRTRGFPISYKWIEDHDAGLYSQSVRLFGNWGNVLRGLGIDPKLMHRKLTLRYPSQEALVAEIKRRHKKGLPINPSAVRHGRQSDFALLSSACDNFGSWNAALTAAGLDPVIMRENIFAPKRCYPSGKAVIERLRTLRRSGQILKCTSIRKIDSILIKSAVRYFGSWRAAMNAAGLELEERITRDKYKNRNEMLAEIRRRVDKGLPINHGAVAKGKYHDYGLVGGVRRHFGSWDAALRSAKINPSVVTKQVHLAYRRYPDRKAVILEIRRRHDAGLPLNRASVRTGRHNDYALDGSGIEYFGSWKTALRAAGIDPKTVCGKPI